MKFENRDLKLINQKILELIIHPNGPDRLIFTEPFTEEILSSINNKILPKKRDLILTFAISSYKHKGYLKDLINLKKLTNIQNLIIHGRYTNNISDIAYLQQLKILYLDCGSNKPSLDPLANLEKLEDLTLAVSNYPEMVKSIRRLTKLIKLQLFGMKIKPVNLRFCEDLICLEKLAVRFSKTRNLDFIKNLKSLKHLKIEQITGYTRDLSFLVANTNLEELSADLRWLNSTPNLTDLKKLRTVYFFPIPSKIKDVSSLYHQTSLEKVGLSVHEEVSYQQLLPIMRLPHLTSFSLVANKSVKKQCKAYCLEKGIEFR